MEDLTHVKPLLNLFYSFQLVNYSFLRQKQMISYPNSNVAVVLGFNVPPTAKVIRRRDFDFANAMQMPMECGKRQCGFLQSG